MAERVPPDPLLRPGGPGHRGRERDREEHRDGARDAGRHRRDRQPGSGEVRGRRGGDERGDRATPRECGEGGGRSVDEHQGRGTGSRFDQIHHTKVRSLAPPGQQRGRTIRLLRRRTVLQRIPSRGANQPHRNISRVPGGLRALHAGPRREHREHHPRQSERDAEHVPLRSRPSGRREHEHHAEPGVDGERGADQLRPPRHRLHRLGLRELRSRGRSLRGKDIAGHAGEAVREPRRGVERRVLAAERGSELRHRGRGLRGRGVRVPFPAADRHRRRDAFAGLRDASAQGEALTLAATTGTCQASLQLGRKKSEKNVCNLQFSRRE
ncbi:hypothetical protein ACHAWF_007503 [Thalassiosira exigua]